MTKQPSVLYVTRTEEDANEFLQTFKERYPDLADYVETQVVEVHHD